MKQFRQAFASRGFVSDSWAFLYYPDATAGKIARKDRAHLSSSAVEASVLVAQALETRKLCYRKDDRAMRAI